MSKRKFTVSLHFEGFVSREIEADLEDAEGWAEAVAVAWGTVGPKEIADEASLTRASPVSSVAVTKAPPEICGECGEVIGEDEPRQPGSSSSYHVDCLERMERYERIRETGK